MKVLAVNHLWTLLLMSVSDNVNAMLENVALGQPTMQKDDYPGWYSDRAVDGHVTDTCTATSEDYHSRHNTWWLVDLWHSYSIHMIRIQNRRDVHTRLTDFYIYVSPYNPAPMLRNENPEQAGVLCLHHPGTLPNNGLQELHCNGGKALQGRYVFVWKPTHHLLTLCEFQVLVDIFKRVGTSVVVYKNQSSSLSPLFSREVDTKKGSPRMRCSLTCATVCENKVTHFQINTHTGLCQCLSVLMTEGLNVSHDVGWELWDINMVINNN